MSTFWIALFICAIIIILFLIVKSQIDKKNRLSAVQRIRDTGFKSTSTIVVRGYKIAVDENRREWLVLPPNGDFKKIFSFEELVGCDVDEIGDHNSTTGIYLRITTSDLAYSSISVPIIYAGVIARNKYNKEGFIHDASMREAHEAVSFVLAIKSKAGV